jgi:hypothetical protein
MVTSPARLWLRCDCNENYRPVLSSERTPHNKETANVLKESPQKIKNNLLRFPDGSLIPEETGLLAVGHKITLLDWPCLIYFGKNLKENKSVAVQAITK